MATLQKIVSNLWFDDQAEQAAKYYTGIFRNSRIKKITYYTKAGYDVHHRKAGSVMTVDFELEGQRFVGLNGGPDFKFNEAVSFIIECDSQDEIDFYWEKLSAGGDPTSQQCGWLKDKFGLSWQVVPKILSDLFGTADSEKSERVMNVMLKMKKLDIDLLQQAYDGRSGQDGKKKREQLTEQL
ncbi:MAG TPA: VOC family protein [Puia sp.]|nr:VOC family protein [Puia sp.]